MICELKGEIFHFLDHVFPVPEPTTWHHCERYILHAQTCATLIDQWEISSIEANRLLNNAGHYLYDHAQYAQAESLYQQALSICEHWLGPNYYYTAFCLSNLATLYYEQGRYAKAERLFQRALSIYEMVLEPTHPNKALCLNNLAMLYKEQGKFAEAKLFYQRALSIYVHLLGPNHSTTTSVRNNYASLLQKLQGEQ